MKYAIILMVAFIVSCEVVVDVDIPVKPASITVYSTINPDSSFQVLLTASQNILSDNPFSMISGAAIDIYEGELLVERLIENNDGLYKGTKQPKRGSRYYVQISKDKYHSVDATDVVPSEDLSFSHVSFVKDESDEYNDQKYTMVVEFDDPKGENYYEIGLYGQDFIYDWSTEPPTIIDSITRQYYIDSQDIIFSDETYNSDAFWMFADDIVDGKSVHISFDTYLYQLHQVDELELTVVLREISYDLYKYKQTANLQQSLDGDPFAEPVPVYNNINNGYGVFGAYQQVTSNVTVNKEE